MYVSIQTLRSMVDLPELVPQKLADKLTLGGFEVESLKTFEDDTILELKVTPNRPDALSHMGIARELAAICHTRTTLVTPSIKELGASIHDLVQVSLISREACLRYACRVIEGVQVAQSPEWLSQKLLSLGLKPIHNIVDITNWVLFERGQPLHAFDADKLAKLKGRFALKIRQADEGEKIITLDGKERHLNPSDVVIADEEKVIALGGIMGGKNTEISKTTQNVLLESAYFEPRYIRKTAKRLGLSTDSSYRFERGTDPNGVILALDRAASLIQEIAGGRVRRDVLDVYPKSIEPLEISLRPKKLAKISGLPESLPVELRTRFLSLGIETAGHAGHDALKFRIPTYRPDITDEVDLIEEAMRLIGFDQVPSRILIRKNLSWKNFDTSLDRLEKHAKIFLSRAGFYEAINYSFGSPTELNKFKTTELMTLKNPLGEEYSAMRQSLFPGLLNNLHHNLKHQTQTVSLFETGIVFWGKNSAGQCPNPAILNTQNSAADSYAVEKFLLSGVTCPGDFFVLKGVLEGLFDSLKLSVDFKPLSIKLSFLHPGQSADIWFEDICFGFLGFLHPDFKEEAQSCVFSLNLDVLKNHCFKTVQFKPLPKFPGIQRDLALMVDEKIFAGEIVSTIRHYKALKPILEDVKIFDVYQGKGIETGKKSVAVSIYMRDLHKTLTEEAINAPIEGLKKELANKLGAVLRTA